MEEDGVRVVRGRGPIKENEDGEQTGVCCHEKVVSDFY